VAIAKAVDGDSATDSILFVLPLLSSCTIFVEEDSEAIQAVLESGFSGKFANEIGADALGAGPSAVVAEIEIAATGLEDSAVKGIVVAAALVAAHVSEVFVGIFAVVSGVRAELPVLAEIELVESELVNWFELNLVAAG
jgi:hypothetical protein